MNYDLKPKTKVDINEQVIVSNKKVANELKAFDKLCFELYPNVNIDQFLLQFNDYYIINCDQYLLRNNKIKEEIKDLMTDHRVFGEMTNYIIDELYEREDIDYVQNEINKHQKVVVYGTGAHLFVTGEYKLCHFNITRWNIQLKLRSGISNWSQNNGQAENTQKFKYGYFFEWRVADKIKTKLSHKLNYMIDSNDSQNLKMISSNGYYSGLQEIVRNPFRLVPFFDPGVWGGQWMKENFSLDKGKENYAWSFDGVPEENSICLEYSNDYIEVPAIDLVLSEPKSLLGEKVFNQFGAEFPIRFDLLDTIGGQNLSLQVHPTKEYIKREFNMDYTQDESYYILDAKADAHVYLGVKTGIDPQMLVSDLEDANSTGQVFNADKYINKIKCKKGDHFLIPAGTIHCSGKDVMVLEVSATPYIFTFKLWDWNRVDLDGKPRPISVDHGSNVINYQMNTEKVKAELVNNFKRISDVEEQTGLHPSQFIETRRFRTNKPITHKTDGKFAMLNLVEGAAATIVSPQDKFAPLVIHHAETFIVPAYIDEYQIVSNNNQEIGYVKAYVR